MLNALALPLVLAGFAPPHAALPVQDDEKTTAKNFVRTLAGEDGELSLEEVKRGLAEIELLVVVDRKFHAADYRLEELRHRMEKACRAEPTCVEFREACVLGLVAHVELQLARGYVEDAKNELPDLQVAEASKHPLAFMAEDARVVQLAAYVDRRLAGDEGEGIPFMEGVPLLGLDAQDDLVEEAVGVALARGDKNFIMEMGGSAVSALVKDVEEELDVLPQPYGDGLYMLARVHPPTAVQLMLRHKDEPGLFWRKRAFRALNETGVMTDASTWDLVNGPAPFECRIPALLQVLEVLVADPFVGTDALKLLQSVVDRGALTQRLQAILGEALDAEDGARRGAAAQLVTASYASENLRPVLESALHSRRPGVRILAAQRLTNLPWSDALAQRVTDSEPGVRHALITMLKSRDLYVFAYKFSANGGNTYLDRVRHVPTYGAAQRAAIASMLRDSSEEIRAAGLSVLSGFPTREEPRSGWARENKTVRRIVALPAPDALLPLANDPSTDVRALLANMVISFPTEVATELLQALADDASQAVLEQVDESLEALPLEDDPARAVEVLRIRVGGPLGFDPRNPKLKEVWDRLKRTPEGCELFATWALEPGAPSFLMLLGRQLRNENNIDSRILKLSPSNYARLIAALEVADGYVQEYLLSRATSPEVQAALLEVGGDTGLSPSLRLKCVAVTAGTGNPTYVSRMVEVLRDPRWPEGRYMDEASLKHFQRAPGEDRNAVLLAVLEDPTSSDALIRGLAKGLAPMAAGGPEAARAILERYYEDPGAEGVEPVWHVFEAMAATEKIRDDELIARAAQHETWWEPALHAIGLLRDPALLPILEDVLRGEKGDERWNTAADAVTGFMTDEAADLLLLAAAGADTGNRREYFMGKLNTLHEYFQARDYWQRRKAMERSREGAVVELYELLADPREPIRVQAIRGLATFEAVEAIPTLIRLLADPSPAVAEAAEQALERLNRVEVADPQQNAGPGQESEDD